jgi:hypothetical protein
MSAAIVGSGSLATIAGSSQKPNWRGFDPAEQRLTVDRIREHGGGRTDSLIGGRPRESPGSLGDRPAPERLRLASCHARETAQEGSSDPSYRAPACPSMDYGYPGLPLTKHQRRTLAQRGLNQPGLGGGQHRCTFEQLKAASQPDARN